MSAIAKLLRISGPALIDGPARLPDALGAGTAVPASLRRMLAQRNGFYAFEAALHVLPAGEAAGVMDLASWNAPTLFRGHYGDLAGGYVFFAEDIFGGQFAFAGDAIVSFDPETGQAEPLARDLEGWAQRLLDDYPYLTGHELAHAWQKAHGRLAPGIRLLPKRPFVLGGRFELANLYAQGAVQGMRLRGDLARQLRDLPDGAKVQFTIVE